VAGQQTNNGTATGQDPNPPNATANNSNPANYFGDAPGIHTVKFVNGQDADSPPGPTVPVGSTLTFTYVVTNTGNVPLANVVVTDNKLGGISSFTGDTNGNGLLDLTETWVYTQTATAVAGQQTNVGTAVAQDANNPPGATVTNNNPANYFGGSDAPAIKIVKFVNGQDADSPPGPTVPVGSTLTFTYVVTNTGNVPLANVVVTDDKLGPITSFTGDTNGNGLLDLTETWVYTQTATALAGQQSNVGSVTAQDANNPPGTTASSSNPANYFGGAAAGAAIPALSPIGWLVLTLLLAAAGVGFLSNRRGA
jgi:large repetitive protein